MAEQVQAVLDQMVPALRDLLDKGIFTESEIRAIVERRRESEYLLRRRAPRKSDYLRYIQAERNLERLRSLRNKKLSAHKREIQQRERGRGNNEKDTKQRKNASTSSIGDASIVQLIHFLFVRAKRKWRDDISWHLQHAEFSKEVKSFQMLGKIYAEALQFHPRNTSLWIEAASHEFFGEVDSDSTSGMSSGGSIQNARVLLQRGLRINEKAQDLWLQYFCLEFHYIQKLRGRREILQLGLKGINGDASFEMEENKTEENSSSSYNALFQEAQLPRVIYKNAIQSVPADVKFRLKFLDMCLMFPQTKMVENDIISSIERDFGDDVEGWIARAQYLVDNSTDQSNDVKKASAAVGFINSCVDRDADSEGENKDNRNKSSKKRKKMMFKGQSSDYYSDNAVMQLLNDATNAIKTPEMYLEIFHFLHSYINQDKEVNEKLFEGKGNAVNSIFDFISFLFEKAESMGISSPDLTLAKAAFFAEIGQPKYAASLLGKVIEKDPICRKDVRCWLKWAEMINRLESLPALKTNLTESTILRKALEVIPLHDVGHWIVSSRLFLKLVMSYPHSSSSFHGDKASQKFKLDEEISSLFQKLLLLSHQTSLTGKDRVSGLITVPELALVYFQHAMTKSEIRLARQVYNKVLFNSNYGRSCAGKDKVEIKNMKAFYDACLCAEKAVRNNFRTKKQIDNGKEVHNILKKLYDSAIRYFKEGGHIKLADTYRKLRNEDLC